MSVPSSAILRSRADALRRFADRIEATAVMTLHDLADVDVWRGPRPNECLALLGQAQTRLQDEADDLRVHATALDRHADEIDAAQTMIGGPL